MERDRPRLTSEPLLVLAAICSLEFGSAFAQTWFDLTGPIGAATLRLVFGAVLLLAFTRPRVGGWTRAHWIGAAALGVSLGVMNTCFYVAVDRIPFGVAVTIEFLGPLALALAQTRRSIDALWAIVAFGGVALIGVGDARDLDPVGVTFAVLAAGCWAAYIVATSRLASRVSGTEGLAVAVSIAALLSLPVGGPDAFGAVAERPATIPVFLGIALLTSALPYALEYRALRRLSTRLFGIMSSLGPAVAAVAGLVVLGQAMHPNELAALVLVTIASMGAVATARERLSPPPAA